MKHNMGRLTNNKRVGYIFDTNENVPTQDALNVRGYTFVVFMENTIRERLIQHVIYVYGKTYCLRLDMQSERSTTGYQVMFRGYSFSTTLEAMGPTRLSHNSLQCSRITSMSSASTSTCAHQQYTCWILEFGWLSKMCLKITLLQVNGVEHVVQHCDECLEQVEVY